VKRTNPAELTAWLYQMTLILVAVATVAAMSAARFGERSWLSTVFCGCVAATLTGFVGTFLANVLFSSLMSGTRKGG
jgi:uncharacterized membrane protein YeaQ/YmgE (transglycosylase-associated protein family)